jgi:hypothetical protein
MLHYYYLGALFLVKFFENKICCYSITGTVDLRVPTKQIRGHSIFNVSNVSKLSPSRRRVTAENNIRKSLDVFNKLNIFLEDTVSFA